MKSFMGIGSLQLGHSITVFIILNSLDSGQEGVDEVPHVSLVGFEVKGLTAGLANDFADVQVVLIPAFTICGTKSASFNRCNYL